MPRTKSVTPSASNPAASAAFTAGVSSLAPPPAPRVWKHAHGDVNIMSVRWLVDQYVGLTTGLRFIVADIYLQICARLPCDEPCAELLECDHPCPSGEFARCLVFGNLADSSTKSAVNPVKFRSVSSV